MNMYIPNKVLWILKQINSQHEEAFLVGGCVRDMLLKREIHDYDITTSMHVEHVIKLFTQRNCHVILTGVKHGTVTIIHQHQAVEITTYRIDGSYQDFRSPKEITFTKDLNMDLKRRDFTINAMAYHPEIGLIDTFNGKEDLQQSMIRCVGNANDRFMEDALRILRALRFRCQLNFQLAFETQEALVKNYQLLHHISRERIRDEFVKLLQSSRKDLLRFLRSMKVLDIIVPGIECIYDFEQHSPWHLYDVFTHTDIALNHSKDMDLHVKLAIVLHDIGKPCSQTFKENIGHYYGHADQSTIMAKKILQSLAFPKKLIEEVTLLIQYHDTYIQTRSGMRKLLFAFHNNIQQIERLFCIQECDDFAKAPKKIEEQGNRIQLNRDLLQEMKQQNDFFEAKDLQVNGKDMMQLGFQKAEIKEVLSYLIKIVLKNPKQNTKKKLMTFAINFRNSQNINSQSDQKIDYKD